MVIDGGNGIDGKPKLGNLGKAGNGGKVMPRLPRLPRLGKARLGSFGSLGNFGKGIVRDGGNGIDGKPKLGSVGKAGNGGSVIPRLPRLPRLGSAKLGSLGSLGNFGNGTVIDGGNGIEGSSPIGILTLYSKITLSPMVPFVLATNTDIDNSALYTIGQQIGSVKPKPHLFWIAGNSATVNRYHILANFAVVNNSPVRD